MDALMIKVEQTMAKMDARQKQNWVNVEKVEREVNRSDVRDVRRAILSW